MHLIEACLFKLLGSAGIAAAKLTFFEPLTIEGVLERTGRVVIIPSDLRNGTTYF